MVYQKCSPDVIVETMIPNFSMLFGKEHQINGTGFWLKTKVSAIFFVKELFVIFIMPLMPHLDYYCKESNQLERVLLFFQECFVRIPIFTFRFFIKLIMPVWNNAMASNGTVGICQTRRIPIRS